jgi:hypothetical protein
MHLAYTMNSHCIFQSYPTVLFTFKQHWRIGSPSHNSIILYIEHTHQSNMCIRRDENKILFGKHILGIYQVYSWNIHGKSIYLVYTWYIPGIYQEKNIWGFQMIFTLCTNFQLLNRILTIHLHLCCRSAPPRLAHASTLSFQFCDNLCPVTFMQKKFNAAFSVNMSCTGYKAVCINLALWQKLNPQLLCHKTMYSAVCIDTFN